MTVFAVTRAPEASVNLLLKRFDRVLVQAHYDNYTKVRFRPDKILDERVFFGKVISQREKWRERGGCLVSWRRVDALEGEHEAILFAECPKSLDNIYAATERTVNLAVIYLPPSWVLHERAIAHRHQELHPYKYRRAMRRLEMLRDYLRPLPTLTPAFLKRTFPLAPSRSSGAPGLPAAEARLSDSAR